MKTLQEIQTIIFPVKEKVDMKEIAKNLITQKFGKNKLISFKEVKLFGSRTYTFELRALAVVDDRLLVLVDEYCEDYPMGTYFSNVAMGENTFDRQYGIGIPDDVLMKACQNMFKNKETHTEFDFKTMTAPDCWATYLEELLDDIKQENNENARKVIHAMEEVAKGEVQGYIKFMDGELIFWGEKIKVLTLFNEKSLEHRNIFPIFAPDFSINISINNLKTVQQ